MKVREELDLSGDDMSQVFRFAVWNVIAVYMALSLGLLVAIVSKADTVFVYAFGILAILLLPWMVLSLRNRRLVIDEEGIVAFDWLGHETVKARFDDIRGIRSSADDPDQSYFEIKTIQGDIDILPLRGRRLILALLREKSHRIPGL